MRPARATIVVTFAAADRPGLVDQLSEVVVAHDGNWEASQMARLAGRFVGILEVSLPEPKAADAVAALKALASRGIEVQTHAPVPALDRTGDYPLLLDLVGNDRPGIVHDIAHVLAARGVNVEEMSTACEPAPVAGGTLFKAKAKLSCPATLSVAELRGILEHLADELMVDIELDKPKR